MVKSISRGHSTLKYITPNARLLGMNVDALMAGNKLTEDYIHPQDRASYSECEECVKEWWIRL